MLVGIKIVEGYNERIVMTDIDMSKDINEQIRKKYPNASMYKII